MEDNGPGDEMDTMPFGPGPEEKLHIRHLAPFVKAAELFYQGSPDPHIGAGDRPYPSLPAALYKRMELGDIVAELDVVREGTLDRSRRQRVPSERSRQAFRPALLGDTVVIDKKKSVAPGCAESPIPGSRQTEIPAHRDILHTGKTLAGPFTNRCRPVARPIIDHDDLQLLRGHGLAGQGLKGAFEQMGSVIGAEYDAGQHQKLSRLGTPVLSIV